MPAAALLLCAASTWVMVTTVPQGQLFRKSHDGSRIDELEARGTLAAPAAAVREVLLHPGKFEGVMRFLEAERIVRAEACEPGANDLPGCKSVVFYNRMAPPLVSKRDYTIRVEISSDALATGGTFHLGWTLANDLGPPPMNDVVRMPSNSGLWEIKADGDRSIFTYRLLTDPGGSLPAWIVDSANFSEVPRMLAALERAAKKLSDQRPALKAPPVPPSAPALLTPSPVRAETR